MPKYWGVVFLCGCSVPNGQPWEQSVSDGVYDVSPVVCTSTQEPPLYRQPEQALVHYSFSGLTHAQMTIQNPRVWRSFADADCKALVILEVSVNAEDEFALRTGRFTEFRPADCTLAITYGGVALDIAQTSSLFLSQDTRDDRSTDISFAVTTTDTGYLLRSHPTAELDRVWETFGCGAADTVEFELRRLTSP